MCRNSYLHRFEIKEEYEQGVKEVCEICGMSKFFRIIDGKVNNYDYMNYHIKQALPSFHPLYPRQYLENNINWISNGPTHIMPEIFTSKLDSSHPTELGHVQIAEYFYQELRHTSEQT